jgi:hypothetical protein
LNQNKAVSRLGWTNKNPLHRKGEGARQQTMYLPNHRFGGEREEANEQVQMQVLNTIATHSPKKQ